MVLFDKLDLKDLDLFSDDGRRHSASFLSYLASLGLSFIYHVIIADRNQHKDMIRKNTPVFRDFLPEALDHGPETGPKVNIPGGIRDNQPSRSNLGYYLGTRSEKGAYLRIRHGSIYYYPLRGMAVVFWDTERIVRPAVWANLREARDKCSWNVDLFLGAHRDRSVEERLEGVRIPKAEMERIEEEFGSTVDYGY